MKTLEDLHFDTRPTLLAAWPGLGNAGVLAMDYIRRETDAQMFAAIDMSAIVTPESIIVHDGIVKIPDLPDSTFHYRKNPDMIFFESNAQPEGKGGIAVIEAVLNVARKFSVSRIFTAGAFAVPMSHNSPSRVLGASNTTTLLGQLEREGVEPLHKGKIVGLNGVLLGIAGTQRIDAACFLATIPAYCGGLPYPKAALGIVNALKSILHLNVDTSSLQEAVSVADRDLENVEERIREYIPEVVNSPEEGTDTLEANPEDITEPSEEESTIYDEARIESLFQKAARNRSYAGELKNELDKWGVFDKFEDRFLDLFENKNHHTDLP